MVTSTPVTSMSCLWPYFSPPPPRLPRKKAALLVLTVLLILQSVMRWDLLNPKCWIQVWRFLSVSIPNAKLFNMPEQCGCLDKIINSYVTSVNYYPFASPNKNLLYARTKALLLSEGPSLLMWIGQPPPPPRVSSWGHKRHIPLSHRLHFRHDPISQLHIGYHLYTWHSWWQSASCKPRPALK